MREIKFRCWNAHANVMHDWSELVAKNKIHLLSNQQASYPIMQFTGLKDCNGVDIYEGDILQDEEYYISEVYWDDECHMWACTDVGGLCDICANIKVIGNIHQNPELLEVQK